MSTAAPSILAGVVPAAREEPGLLFTLASGEERSCFGGFRSGTWHGLQVLEFEDGSRVVLARIEHVRPTTRGESEAEAVRPNEPIPVAVVGAVPVAAPAATDDDLADWTPDQLRAAYEALAEKETKTGRKLEPEELAEMVRLAALLRERGPAAPPSTPAPTAPLGGFAPFSPAGLPPASPPLSATPPPTPTEEPKR